MSAASPRTYASNFPPMDPNTQAPSSRKGLYIAIAVVAVIIVGWLLTRGGLGMLGAPAGVGVDRHLDGSTTYSNNEGSVTVGSNKLPDTWPSDAPAYPNGTIQYSGSSNPQTGATGAAVVFETQDSAPVIADFYKKELAAKGWAIEQTANMGAGTVIAAKKDSRTFGLYIADAGASRSVTVGIELPQQ